MTQGALIRNVADCQALYMQAKQTRSDILYMTTLDTGRCSHNVCLSFRLENLVSWRAPRPFLSTMDLCTTKMLMVLACSVEDHDSALTTIYKHCTHTCMYICVYVHIYICIYVRRTFMKVHATYVYMHVYVVVRCAFCTPHIDSLPQHQHQHHHHHHHHQHHTREGLVLLNIYNSSTVSMIPLYFLSDFNSSCTYPL